MSFCEGAFKNHVSRSHILYYIPPPAVHLTAYVTGGCRKLYGNLKRQGELEIPDNYVFTDDEGKFVPYKNMPVMARRYKFIDVIGSGQSATLIGAKDLFNSSKLVAIKVLNRHGSQLLCAQEADTMRRLNHADPYCVSGTLRLYNVFRFEGHYCMVFELLDPRPLHKYSIHSFMLHKRLDAVRQIAFHLLRTIGFLHQQNVIHGDLKPENILLKKKADFSSVTVLDFGNSIHCVHEDLSLYYDTFDFQTLLYRAPEVIYGMPFGIEVDMWSYGCILAELYLGWPLFDKKMEKGKTLSKGQILSSMLEFLGWLPRKIYVRGKYFTDLKCYTADTQQPDATLNLMKKLDIRDFHFANFLAACLKYDPGKRVKVWEAAQMPFLSAYFGHSFLMPQFKNSYNVAKHDGVANAEAYPYRPEVCNPSAQHMTSHQLLRHGTKDSKCDTSHKAFTSWKKEPGTRKVAQVTPVQRNTPSPDENTVQQPHQEQTINNPSIHEFDNEERNDIHSQNITSDLGISESENSGRNNINSQNISSIFNIHKSEGEETKDADSQNISSNSNNLQKPDRQHHQSSPINLLSRQSGNPLIRSDWSTTTAQTYHKNTTQTSSAQNITFSESLIHRSTESAFVNKNSISDILKPKPMIHQSRGNSSNSPAESTAHTAVYCHQPVNPFRKTSHALENHTEEKQMFDGDSDYDSDNVNTLDEDCNYEEHITNMLQQTQRLLDVSRNQEFRAFSGTDTFTETLTLSSPNYETRNYQSAANLNTQANTTLTSAMQEGSYQTENINILPMDLSLSPKEGLAKCEPKAAINNSYKCPINISHPPAKNDDKHLSLNNIEKNNQSPVSNNCQNNPAPCSHFTENQKSPKSECKVDSSSVKTWDTLSSDSVNFLTSESSCSNSPKDMTKSSCVPPSKSKINLGETFRSGIKVEVGETRINATHIAQNEVVDNHVNMLHQENAEKSTKGLLGRQTDKTIDTLVVLNETFTVSPTNSNTHLSNEEGVLFKTISGKSSNSVKKTLLPCKRNLESTITKEEPKEKISATASNKIHASNLCSNRESKNDSKEFKDNLHFEPSRNKHAVPCNENKVFRISAQRVLTPVSTCSNDKKTWQSRFQDKPSSLFNSPIQKRAMMSKATRVPKDPTSNILNTPKSTVGVGIYWSPMHSRKANNSKLLNITETTDTGKIPGTPTTGKKNNIASFSGRFFTEENGINDNTECIGNVAMDTDSGEESGPEIRTPHIQRSTRVNPNKTMDIPYE